MTQTIEVAKLVPWGPAKEVRTKHGPRMLSKGPCSDRFWAIWKTHKAELKKAGVSCSKSNGGQWEACWWQPIDQVAKQTALDASRATDVDLAIPSPDGLEYLPYQKAGIAYALDRRNCLIADEMGLGKTIQAIGVMNSRPQEKTILILCPASLKLNWAREIEKWDTCNRVIQIVKTGKDRPDFVGRVTIMNFELADKLREHMRLATFDRVIVDESHRLKNQKAKSTKAVYGYWDQRTRTNVPGIAAANWTLLTGTPILNRPVELWTALRKLDPDGLGHNFMKFALRHCAAYRDRYGINVSGHSNLDELQERLRERCMVRRLKKEVLKDLPPKVRQVIPLEQNGNKHLVKQERDLLAQREETLQKLAVARELAKAAGEKTEYENAIAALHEELQVAFTEMARVRKELGVSKIPAVIDHLEDALEEAPVVVFCWHTALVDALREKFPDAGVVVGSTSQPNRQKAVDDFQAGRTDLIIGNIRAMGVGLTLTRSSHVVFAELDWVPANLSQAEDRCHRIGQTNSVLVQHLVVDGSLDAEMAQRCIAKQQVMDEALDLMTARDPVLPLDQPATVDIDWDAVTAAAKQYEVDPELVEAVHMGLKILARVCDGAVAADMVGFNAVDSRVGKSLAMEEKLTARQAVLGQKILWKYHAQLPEEINTQIRVDK